MSITHVSTTQAQNGTGSSILSLTRPLSMADNDVVFVSIVLNTAAGSISAPAGFNTVAVGSDATDDTYCGVYWKHIQNAASEPSTYDFNITNSKAAGLASAYRNADYNNPVYRYAQTVINSSSYPPSNLLDYPYSGALGGKVLVFAAVSNSASFNFTGGNLDAPTASITELGDVTSTGGGAGTGKVAIAAAYIPSPYLSDVNSDGITDFNGGNYRVNIDGGSAYRILMTTVGLRSIDSPVVGEPLTIDGSSTVSELRVQPVQWTAGKLTARTSSVGGEAPHISNPDAVYEVISQGRMAGFYAEYDSNAYPREQEGKAVTFLPKTAGNYSEWLENDSEYTWQGQYYGSAAIDTARINDNKFVVLYSEGHAADYYNPPNENAYWVSGAYAKILRVNGTTVTQEASAAMAPDNSYLGNVVTDGQNSVIYSGNINATTPSYGARIWHYNGSVWALGSQHSYASDGRTIQYATAAAHVPEQKIVFFYSDQTLNGYVARVGNITNDVNARPTVITYGTEYVVPNTQYSGTYSSFSKPLVLSGTEGVIAIKQTNAPLQLSLIKYTIGVGDVITFDSPIAVWTDTVTTHSKQGLVSLLYHQNRIIMVYTTYRNVSPYYTVRMSIFGYNATSGVISLESDEELSGFSTTYKVSNPTLSAGNGPYFHLNYFDFSVSNRLPVFKTFNIPLTQVETDGTNDLGAYIHVGEPNPFDHTQALTCFIQTEGISSGLNMFIGSSTTGLTSGPSYAYIYGRGTQSESVLAHIVYVPPAESSVNCMIHAGAEVGDIGAYVSGPDIQEGSTNLFMWANAPISEYLYCFMDATKVVTANNIGGIRLEAAKTQYLEFNDNINIRPTSEFTMNFWMKGYDTYSSGNLRTFIEKDFGTSQTIGIYEKSVAGSQGWHFGIYSAGAWNAVNSVGSWTADQWYMVTLRYNGSTVSLYINGILDNSFAKTGDISWTTDPWRVGYRQNTGQYTNMGFARFKLWNYALTDQEIEDLYGRSLNAALGCYMFGETPQTISSGQYVYLNSQENASNPISIQSNTLLMFPQDSVQDNQNCHVVGAPVNSTWHDMHIVIDNFEMNRFDMVLRVNGQGETALTKILGDIDYPVSRQATIFLEGIYFPDMPGKAYENLAVFLNAGNTATTSLGAYIGGPVFIPSFLQVYLHGHFISQSSNTNCFIVQNDTTVSQLAYIHNDSGSVEREQHIYIEAPIDSVEGGSDAFTYGWDLIESNNQKVFIHTIEWGISFTQLFIEAGTVLNIRSDIGQKAFIPANAQVYDPAQFCFIDGVYYAPEIALNAFVHTQPVVQTDPSTDVACYVAAPYPYIPLQELLIYMNANAPITDNTPCYIQSNPNITSTTTTGRSYIRGFKEVEIRQLLYVTNIEILQTNSFRQSAYIAAPQNQSVSVGCFISGQQETGYVRCYIPNAETTLNKTVSKRCFIVGAGGTAMLNAFIFGSLSIENNPFQPIYIIG